MLGEYKFDQPVFVHEIKLYLPILTFIPTILIFGINGSTEFLSSLMSTNEYKWSFTKVIQEEKIYLFI